jgi:hypothetical protein
MSFSPRADQAAVAQCRSSYMRPRRAHHLLPTVLSKSVADNSLSGWSSFGVFAIENGLDFILCEAFVVKHAIFLSLAVRSCRWYPYGIDALYWDELFLKG